MTALRTTQPPPARCSSMAQPLKHAQSSARKFGGKAEDYCAQLFGVAITNSDGKQVPVRYVGEQHVKEDLGRIPTAQDWLLQIKPQRWMYGQRLDEETTSTKEEPE